jgi:hypothetical protein
MAVRSAAARRDARIRPVARVGEMRTCPCRHDRRVLRRWRAQVAFAIVIVALAAVVGVQLASAVPAAVRPSPSPTAIDWAGVRPGADASWPSCTPPHGSASKMPLAVRPAFVVVGVNDGLPGTVNACIERELQWAGTTTGGSSQQRLAYYVMAADPWTKRELKWVPHPLWPSSNLVGGRTVVVPVAFASDATGTTCAGGHTERACAYVYGWTMALHAASIPGLRDPAGHRFWIDVEAERTWSDDQRFNQAVVEGMVAAYTAPRSRGGVGTTTGVYSDHSEWSTIIGRLRKGSPLDGLDQWLAIGPSTKAEAVDALLHDWPLTPGGRITAVQWVDGRIDRSIARPAGG